LMSPMPPIYGHPDAHPNAPAGGSGPGCARKAAPAGATKGKTRLVGTLSVKGVSQKLDQVQTDGIQLVQRAYAEVQPNLRFITPEMRSAIADRVSTAVENISRIDSAPTKFAAGAGSPPGSSNHIAADYPSADLGILSPAEFGPTIGPSGTLAIGPLPSEPDDEFPEWLKDTLKQIFLVMLARYAKHQMEPREELERKLEDAADHCWAAQNLKHWKGRAKDIRQAANANRASVEKEIETFGSAAQRLERISKLVEVIDSAMNLVKLGEAIRSGDSHKILYASGDVAIDAIAAFVCPELFLLKIIAAPVLGFAKESIEQGEPGWQQQLEKAGYKKGPNGQYVRGGR
jgi:hypothetical protein